MNTHLQTGTHVRVCVCVQIKTYFKISKGFLNHIWTITLTERLNFFSSLWKRWIRRIRRENWEEILNLLTTYLFHILILLLDVSVIQPQPFCFSTFTWKIMFSVLSCVRGRTIKCAQNAYKRNEWCEKFDIDNWKRVIHIKSNEQKLNINKEG